MIASGGSFIEFDIHSQTDLTAVPTLTIEVFSYLTSIYRNANFKTSCTNSTLSSGSMTSEVMSL